MLLNQYAVSGYMNIVAAIIVAFILVEVSDPLLLLTWVSINVIVIMFRMNLYSNFREKMDVNNINEQPYHKVFIAFMAFAGIYWGVGIYQFLPQISETELFVTFLSIIFILASANMPNQAASIPCNFAFLSPIMLGLLIRIYQLDNFVLLFCVFMFFVFLGTVAIRLNKITLNALSLDAQNKILLKTVTVEKNIALAANNEKSQFLAAASHDLRQPLNSMGLLLYAFKKRTETILNHKQSKILSQIDNSYLALKGLFDSLLEISHLDAGTITAETQVVSLATIVTPLTDDFRALAKSKGLKFTYVASTAFVKTDSILLSRVIRNLLDNAIKYTHKGHVSLIESVSNGVISIQVSDSGIGIPEKDYQSIFNEYQQLSNKRRDRHNGIGLGLSIVKKIIFLIDGSIDVTSNIGLGSTFTIRLKSINKREYKIPFMPVVKEISSAALIGKKILVVDDELDVLKAMILILADWHCITTTAETYEQAITQIESSPSDLIICDYRLQDDMTGIDVINNIKNKIGFNIPSLLITGDTDPSLLSVFKSKGLSVLMKPVNPIELKKSLIQLLKNQTVN